MEESRRNFDKISGCCQLYEIHFMVSSVPHLFRLQKGGTGKICYFRGDPKFKGGAVTLKDTMHLENISWFLRMEKILKYCLNFALWLSSYMFFCLEFHFQVKVNSCSSVRVIWCFAGTGTLTICMLVLHQ